MSTRQACIILAVTAHALFWVITLIVLTIWSFFSGYISEYAINTGHLIFGDADIGTETFTLSEVPRILAIIPLMLIFSSSITLLVAFYSRNRRNAFNSEGHKVSELVSKVSQFNVVMLALRAGLVEEALFRWFPLAFMTGFASQVPINFFVIGSSCIFALIHLRNFPKEQRNIIFVLPQFFVGLLLSYVFLRWGFGGAAFVHFMYDLALMLLIKNWMLATKYAQLVKETSNAA